MKVCEFENLKKEIERNIAEKNSELRLDNFEFAVNKRYRFFGRDVLGYDSVLFLQRMSTHNYIAVYCQSINGSVIQDTAVIQSFHVKNTKDLVDMRRELVKNTNIFDNEIENILINL